MSALSTVTFSINTMKEVNFVLNRGWLAQLIFLLINKIMLMKTVLKFCRIFCEIFCSKINVILAPLPHANTQSPDKTECNRCFYKQVLLIHAQYTSAPWVSAQQCWVSLRTATDCRE